jgi:hypothetical protein
MNTPYVIRSCLALPALERGVNDDRGYGLRSTPHTNEKAEGLTDDLQLSKHCKYLLREVQHLAIHIKHR